MGSRMLNINFISAVEFLMEENEDLAFAEVDCTQEVCTILLTAVHVYDQPFPLTALIASSFPL